MKPGDRLTVIEGEYCGYVGVMAGLTSDGLVTVRFGGRWEASFWPHHVELAPATLWNLLAAPTQWDWSSTPGYFCDACQHWFPAATHRCLAGLRSD